MSNTQVRTDYNVQLDVEGQGGSVLASFNMSTQLGFTDDLVLSFVQTLRSFPWPAGTSVNVQALKTIDTLESFQGHLDTNPPSFT